MIKNEVKEEYISCKCSQNVHKSKTGQKRRRRKKHDKASALSCDTAGNPKGDLVTITD